MGEKTEAQKKAQQKYMEKFAVARVRMNREKYEQIQAHAEAQGDRPCERGDYHCLAGITPKMIIERVENL